MRFSNSHRITDILSSYRLPLHKVRKYELGKRVSSVWLCGSKMVKRSCLTARSWLQASDTCPGTLATLSEIPQEQVLCPCDYFTIH